MCFVWISEQTAIISLYSINWLVFITEAECVCCAVRTGSSNAIQGTLTFHRFNIILPTFEILLYTVLTSWMLSESVRFYYTTDLYKQLSFPKEIKQIHIIPTLSMWVILCVCVHFCVLIAQHCHCVSPHGGKRSMIGILERMWEKDLWHNPCNIQEFVWRGV
jgi:hypothetical protein